MYSTHSVVITVPIVATQNIYYPCTLTVFAFPQCFYFLPALELCCKKV